MRWLTSDFFQKEKLSSFNFEEKATTVPMPARKCLHPVYKMCTWKWFDKFIMGCVIANIVFILLEVRAVALKNVGRGETEG